MRQEETQRRFISISCGLMSVCLTVSTVSVCTKYDFISTFSIVTTMHGATVERLNPNNKNNKKKRTPRVSR